MKIIFAGTPEVALPSLRALIDGPHEVIRVVSRPDAPLGRKRVLTPSPVAAAAEEAGIPVTRAARLSGESAEELTALPADLGVVVAYGGLIREPLLSAPRLGWINLHFSLLPAWRGAAPVQRALMAGDRRTGAQVFQLVAALDAGDILGELEHEIDPDATAGELLQTLAVSGAELLARVVEDLAAGRAVPRPQVGEPSHAAKLTLEDGLLAFDAPVARIYDRFRGVTPEPGAFTLVDGERMKILEARPVPAPEPGVTSPASAAASETPAPGQIRRAGKTIIVGCADGALELLRVQPAGKQAMGAGDWWRGLGPNPQPEAQR